MEQTKINTIEQARNKAIEWQSWASNQALSYSEILEWEDYFKILADQFGLTEEFIENGII